MSLLEVSRTRSERIFSLLTQPFRRLVILAILLCVASALNVLLIITVPVSLAVVTPFLLVWLVAFVPYLAACLFVLVTPQPRGRWLWLELGIILAGALFLRVMLLPVFPFLSHDVLRYLWDARVTLHGYSPYTTIPESRVLQPLRDTLLYPNMGYLDVPTLYPPGAQAIYIISYLLAGPNIIFLKGIFMLFDLTSCAMLAYLLWRKGLDPRRCIIYAWCPLVTVEFALQGHVDVLTIAFSILALLCAAASWRGARIVTGFLIAMATLTKLYPILLLVVVIRRRDYALFATCLLTLLAFYAPYLVLGHGSALGFFTAYVDQHPTNQGIVPLTILWLSHWMSISLSVVFKDEFIVDALIAIAVTCSVLILRWRARMSMEAGYLILMGMIFAISSHVFPWYTTALLPWIVFLVGAPWQPGIGIQGRALASLMVWYFACILLIAYFFAQSSDWRIYYVLVYGVTLLGLVWAALVWFRRWRHGGAKHLRLSNMTDVEKSTTFLEKESGV